MNCTIIENIVSSNMGTFILILSFNNLCDIVRNCYPEVRNGNYCLSDPRLSDIPIAIQDDIEIKYHYPIIFSGGEEKISENYKQI